MLLRNSKWTRDLLDELAEAAKKLGPKGTVSGGNRTVLSAVASPYSYIGLEGKLSCVPSKVTHRCSNIDTCRTSVPSTDVNLEGPTRVLNWSACPRLGGPFPRLLSRQTKEDLAGTEIPAPRPAASAGEGGQG